MQSGEQSKLPHLQLEQSPLHEHLIVYDMIWKSLELSSKLIPMTLILWSRQSPLEKEPLAVFECRSSRFPLDTLHDGHAGVVHRWWVAVCPLLDSYGRRVLVLS